MQTTAPRRLATVIPLCVTVMLFLSSASATPPLFGTASVRLGVQPESLCVADLDGDGHVDAVVTGATVHGLEDLAGTIYFGRGDGTFDRAGPRIAGAVGLAALGDVTGDGALDLVTVDHGTLNILAGNGAGGFGAPIEVFAADHIFRPVIADLDGTAPAEIVIAALGNAVDPNPTGVYILGVNGAGGFVIQQSVIGIESVSRLEAREPLAVGDVNGDGARDVVIIVGDDTQELVVLLNDGAGALDAPDLVSLPASNNAALWTAITAGDLSGDGVDDVALASQSGLVMAMYRGGDSGLATPIVLSPFPTQPGLSIEAIRTAIRIHPGQGGIPGELLVIDQSAFIGTGGEDFSGPGGAIDIYTGDTLQTFARVATGYAGPRPIDLASIDLNADGRSDSLALVDYQETVLSPLNPVAQGAGGILSTFLVGDSQRILAPRPLTIYSLHRGVALVDADFDADLDILTMNRGAIEILRNTDGVQPQASVQEQFFTIPVEFQSIFSNIPFSTGDSAAVILAAPIGRPPVPELISLGPAFGLSGGYRTVFPGAEPDGDEFIPLLGLHSMLDAAVGDVTGDGFDEAIMLGTFGSGLHLLIAGSEVGPTGGLIPIPDALPLGRNRVETCDIDGDGIRDIIATDHNRAIIVRSMGGGAFAEPVSLAAGALDTIAALECADLNHDGAPEIIVGGFGGVNATDPGVMIYWNDGANDFGEPEAVASSNGILDVKARDMDNDGARDLVLATFAGFVEILHGDGFGGFASGELINVGSETLRLDMGEVTGDGRLDIIAIGSKRTGSVGSPTFRNTRNAIFLIESTGGALKFADLDGDGVIGAGDISSILGAWGPCAPGPCPADLNDDSVVDGGDISFVLSLWE